MRDNKQYRERYKEIVQRRARRTPHTKPGTPAYVKPNGIHPDWIATGYCTVVGVFCAVVIANLVQ